MTGLDCVRCAEAIEPGDDRDAAVCGPCIDEMPVTPRPDVACLVGPDDEPPADPYAAALARLGIAAATIDEPDGSGEWERLAADLARALDDDTLDDAELDVVLRELLLRAWECGAADDGPRDSDGRSLALAGPVAAVRDARDDATGVREALRRVRTDAGSPVLPVERVAAELGAIDTRLAELEAALTDALPEDGS